MVFPVVFRKGAEAVIASFDGIDLIQGKGLVKLLGGGTQDSAGIKYRLSKMEIKAIFQMKKLFYT